ncbi:serine hydrolase domain-containing protein [Microvirga massiliensis]|uniref:serine hydrolase domain-containing protein n=1 Tax=Microvirga massiliensis TaxID=1033741 RepID=UPI000A909F5C|nr:serine hydrolase domain-containing protein [Microvirga massiliensis]
MTMDRRDFLKTSGLSLLAATSLTQHAFGQSGGNGALKEMLDTALSRPVERGDIPGAVAGVTDKSQTTYLAAFGERALGQGVRMTPDSVFNIASMTKAITGTAAMQLVEQGKLELDVPISTYIPRAAEFQVLEGFDGNGEPRLRAPKRQITLRHLMTHTSGLVYDQWDADFLRFAKARNFPVLGSGANEGFYPPLMFDPGERWEYGISIDWIGLLVEKISGQSLGTYMQEHIFAPLGMTSTGYRLMPDTEARRVATHQRGSDGKLTEVEWKGQPQPVRELGGGGLYSTVGDYLQFVRMILNNGTGNGHQVLKPETVALMGKNAMGDTRVVMLKTTNPARSEDAEFFPGLPKSWGLTFMINEEQAPTGRSAGSLAWAGLYNTFFWIDPSKGMGGVFMAQVLPFVDPKTLQAFYDFETAAYHATS